MVYLIATGSTKLKKKRNIIDQWTPEYQDAFVALKWKLVEVPVPIFPRHRINPQKRMTKCWKTLGWSVHLTLPKSVLQENASCNHIIHFVMHHATTLYTLLCALLHSTHKSIWAHYMNQPAYKNS